MGKVEYVFEKFLWNYRLIILLGIIGLLISSLMMFAIGVIETYYITAEFISMIMEDPHQVKVEYAKILMNVITTVDSYLLGIVLLIFGLGTYDLFISKLDPAEMQSDIRPDWLIFNTLEELKSVLGKVVLMIMTITFLRYILSVDLADGVENNDPGVFGY